MPGQQDKLSLLLIVCERREVDRLAEGKRHEREHEIRVDASRDDADNGLNDANDGGEPEGTHVCGTHSRSMGGMIGDRRCSESCCERAHQEAPLTQEQRRRDGKRRSRQAQAVAKAPRLSASTIDIQKKRGQLLPTLRAAGAPLV